MSAEGSHATASITYYVVVPFQRDEDGMIVPAKAQDAPNREAAQRRASAMVGKVAGAIAFQRTGAPEAGDFKEGEVIAEFGDVDRNALYGLASEPYHIAASSPLGCRGLLRKAGPVAYTTAARVVRRRPTAAAPSSCLSRNYRI